jgi:ABC-2 type transport system permease protein
MIKLILSLFIPFRWLIEKMGADYNQFIILLKLKLTLDNRNVKSISGKQEKTQIRVLFWQSVSQIFIGSLFALFLSIVKSQFTYYYFSHTFIMAMMAMMIISEFTTILFDTSENAIIQPLPVKGNTISLARNAHVFTYLSLMAFNLSFLSIILAISKFGIVSGAIYVFTILLNVMFTLFLANILYLAIMRLATGEQLKNLLMYFQIAIAILFMAGYQFGLNIVDRTVFENMVLPVRWYTFLVPPAFFAGSIEAFASRHFESTDIIFILETIVVPAAAIYFTGKYLTPVFNRKLLELEQGDRNSKVKTEVSGRMIWLNMMSWVFAYGAAEKASFKLMWKMTGRERLFLQTLLPSYGYIIIMIVLPLFTKKPGSAQLGETDKYLFLLYAFLFIAATLPVALLTGNNKQAAWIFKSIPLGSPAELFKGFINAAFARFFIPLYIAVSVVVCVIWGIKVLPDVIIALMSIYFFTLLFYFLQHPYFPFSLEKSASSGGAGVIKVFGILVLAAAVGFLHKILIHWLEFTNLILVPFYFGAILYVNRIFVHRKITWKEVDRVNSY